MSGRATDPIAAVAIVGDSPRIALVKLSSLGDVVHALPVAAALRTRWPAAEIVWIAEQRESALLQGSPHVDRVVPVDTRRWRRQARRLREAQRVLGEIRAAMRRLRGPSFDVVLDAQGLWKSGAVTRVIGAPVRIGFARPHCREAGNAWFTTHRVRLGPEPRHVVEQNLALLGGLGITRAEVGSPRFGIAADPLADSTVARFLEEEGVKPDTPLCLLHPGAGRASKRWGVDAFRRLGEALAHEFGARPLIGWGPGEEALAREIAQGMRPAPLIPPPTSIPELVALLRRASVVVGGDTGPIHVAAALGVPTVGLHGPTPVWRNGPYGPRTRGLQSPTGRMDGIDVPAVRQAVRELLG